LVVMWRPRASTCTHFPYTTLFRSWATDKDGLLLGLLAAEITAVTGRDPGVHYAELTTRLGAPIYTRIDTPSTPAEKAGFKRLTRSEEHTSELQSRVDIVCRLLLEK